MRPYLMLLKLWDGTGPSGSCPLAEYLDYALGTNFFTYNNLF